MELLEHLYAKMYEQRLREPDERYWQHRILPSRRVVRVDTTSVPKKLRLVLEHGEDDNEMAGLEEVLEADAVIVATGYKRDAHEDFLQPARHLMPQGSQTHDQWAVGRNYRVQMDPRKVSSSAGVWLQGCNEGTHGVRRTCSVHFWQFIDDLTS